MEDERVGWGEHSPHSVVSSQSGCSSCSSYSNSHTPHLVLVVEYESSLDDVDNHHDVLAFHAQHSESHRSAALSHAWDRAILSLCRERGGGGGGGAFVSASDACDDVADASDDAPDTLADADGNAGDAGHRVHIH